MHVVIANPFDSLPWEGKRLFRYSMLAAELTSRGHQVSWITADFSHGTKSYRKQVVFDESVGAKIMFVHVPPYHKNISWQRIISHNAYAKGVAQTLRTLHASEPVDLVIASIPPTKSARVAMEFCAETGVLGLVDMQDPWPKVLESVFPQTLRKFFSVLLLGWFKQDVKLATELASSLVAISPETLDYLVSFRQGNQIPQASFILGFDGECIQISEIEQKKTTNPLIVSYIGNFGYFNDLETVVKAAAICANKNIEFILIGDGPIYKSVKLLAEKLSLTNVKFTGRLPFETALPLLQQSAVGLVSYTVDFPPNTVNKTFDYLCLGLPVVSSLRGLFAKDLAEFNLGLQYEAGNANSLANALLHLEANPSLLHEMGKRGLEYARENMDAKVIYKEYASFLENLTGELVSL